MNLKFKSQQSVWEKFREKFRLFFSYGLPEFAAKFIYVPPFPAKLTIDDWINLSLDVSSSASQFQKAYDWKISQWSSFANMILTALLSFLSACVIEFYKSGFVRPQLRYVMLAGFVGTIALYLISLNRVASFRRAFLRDYALILWIKSKR
jgi:hypothetical protein